ncbi:acyltransferase family protein [Novosphingobium sp.]|uniref:acyltransferase family protein n=1 Tax=Novosphingobium sp. TaxID=1874826 RepID=UPI003B519DA4
MSQKHQHYVGMDGFRGIAAILVAVIHISQESKIPTSVNNFPMAVDFFFMLSGYVIALSYERKIADGQLDLAGFIKLRLMRLYPMIFFAAVLGITWRMVEGRFSVGSIAISGVAALLLLPVARFSGGHSTNSYPINGPSWSLTHEMIANIVFAAFAGFFRNGRVLAVVTALVSLIEIIVGVRLGRLDFSTAWADQGYAVLRAMAPFLVGALIYRSSRIWKPVVSNGVPLAGALVLALVLFAPFENVFYSIACIYLIFPAIIFAGMVQPKSAWLITVFAVLGEISYPLYAVNQPLARWLNYFAGRYATINPQVYIVVALALVTAIAFGISRLYDIPVRAMLRRKLASPRMAQTNGL